MGMTIDEHLKFEDDKLYHYFPLPQYGDGHKLYGYTDYGNVSSSFDYLFKTALCKDEMFKEYLKCKCPAKEAYDLFSIIGASPDIILSEDEFDVFTKLYLSDFQRTYPGEDISYIEDYMIEMSNKKGNKILYWC